MATFRNTFAGGTIDAEVTAANSGGASGTAWTAISPTSFYYKLISGVMTMQVVNPAALAQGRWQYTTLASKVKMRIKFKYTPATADHYPVTQMYGTTVGTDVSTAWTFMIVSSKIRITTKGSDGAATTRYQGTTTLVADTVYTVEVYAEAGTTAATGAIRAWLSDASGTQLEDSTKISAINTAGVAGGFTNLKVGVTNGATTVTQTVFDIKATTDVDAVEGRESFAANVAPTVTSNGNVSATAGGTASPSVTASDSDGTIASYAWSFAYSSTGSNPTLTNSTTANPSFTVGTAGSLYILTCTVTDNVGATASVNVEVRVPLAATGSEMRPLNAAPTGTWTPSTGSSASVMADETDTTYMESPTLTASEAVTRSRYQPSSNRSDGSVTIRCAKTDAGSATLTVRLFVGNGSSTVIESWTISPTTTIADYAHTLVSGTISTITGISDGWNQLYVELAATT